MVGRSSATSGGGHTRSAEDSLAALRCRNCRSLREWTATGRLYFFPTVLHHGLFFVSEMHHVVASFAHTFPESPKWELSRIQ